MPDWILKLQQVAALTTATSSASNVQSPNSPGAKLDRIRQLTSAAKSGAGK